MGCSSSTTKVGVMEPVFTGAGIDDVRRPVVDMTPLGKGSAEVEFHAKHVVLNRLGQGAFARVYSVLRKPDFREFAVKVTDLASPTDGHLSCRMQHVTQKEVAIMKRLGKQEHCVGLVDHFVEGMLSYMVIELCDQTLLEALEQSPKLNEGTYVPVFRDMLKALESIHKMRIAHLDVKPDNFLCSQGVVKLCDFGVSNRIKQDSPGLKDIYGTAPFMAPEMLLGHRYDEGADMWSFAVIVYVLFFGQFPYKPVDRSSTAMKAAVALGYPAPSFRARSCLLSSTQGSAVSDTAMSFVRSALKRETDKRWRASQALQHEFVRQPPPTAAQLDQVPIQESPLPSLRPMLVSAKRVGAFTPFDPNKPDKDDGEGTLESRLATLQACHHTTTLFNTTAQAEDPKPLENPPTGVTAVSSDRHSRSLDLSSSNSGASWCDLSKRLSGLPEFVHRKHRAKSGSQNSNTTSTLSAISGGFSDRSTIS